MQPGHRISFHLAFLLFVLLFAANCSASIVISIRAGELRNAQGTSAIAEGTLIQLVNLGANGIFDEVNFFDGQTSGPGLWVSGDDTLINVPFSSGNEMAGDFSTAAAFDLRHSSVPESTTGTLARVFEFQTGAIPQGTPLGIRWWPQFKAADFGSITLSTFTSSPIAPRYGQFTRQPFSMLLHGGTFWRAPGEGGNVTFDIFSTTTTTLPDSTDDAIARNGPLAWPFPEPASVVLLSIGGLFAATVRRRSQQL